MRKRTYNKKGKTNAPDNGDIMPVNTIKVSEPMGDDVRSKIALKDIHFYILNKKNKFNESEH